MYNKINKHDLGRGITKGKVDKFDKYCTYCKVKGDNAKICFNLH